MQREVKWKAGRWLVPVLLRYEGDRIWIKHKFNKTLLAETQAMEGARWHGFYDPPVKQWSVANSPHNEFQFRYLAQENPYAPYQTDLVKLDTHRSLYDHQFDMASQIYSRHYGIIAGEMGVGKTLAWIVATEWAGLKTSDEVWYVGPRAGVKAVTRELRKWEAGFQCHMMTYEQMVKVVADWGNRPAPRMICFDESSKIKNKGARRSQAAKHVADAVRKEWGWDGYVVLMSGTPAPRTPIDWWWQCEVAMPGFLKEGEENKFRKRLCLTEKRTNLITGGVYPHMLTWLDDELKCAECGRFENEHEFDELEEFEKRKCKQGFKESINEVQFLYKRMSGLVMVKWKKDCLDLPDKQYQIIQVKPTPDMLRTAKAIKGVTAKAIVALHLLRELSDGFQYTEEVIGKKQCPVCLGNKTQVIQLPTEKIDPMAPTSEQVSDFVEREVICDTCGGVGEVSEYRRSTDVVTSPKDQIFLDDLEAHEEIGRYLVWGGFTGTVDRLVEMAQKHCWSVLRVDGRGYHAFDEHGEVLDSDELLDAMDASHPRRQELLEKYPKICFVGQPGAGGMALTLTMAPTAMYYSNTFNGEARMQSEDRIHRAGMDNRAPVIKDLFCLGSDKLVLENLKKKKKLQNLTLGEVFDAFTGDV
jgi:hypothetical protein